MGLITRKAAAPADPPEPTTDDDWMGESWAWEPGDLTPPPDQRIPTDRKAPS